ncbi:type II toxin-antitoxin system RelE/ParE family toxin [Nocardiopsis sp. RSe5-2]|uniref:Type II toxin-antitoxin system RelE/ParE family toxin n=1 Tax=Nocardiopsis endophytica TaxID=3018445 RepID=A0ABT4U6N4_9ACTN|nr:type II toxin-antitoxin system RelE/ParE family toxin [Nocardiopsis endophytica]MDA2812608.1 type II toxin-antitoxin system RelE/ParE family toxin [Nocardiopsis endophytica]
MESEVLFDGRASKEPVGADEARQVCHQQGRLWRIRVGEFRVVYMIDDGELVVVALRAAHRREVYRGL